jgi:hypothetical protein
VNPMRKVVAGISGRIPCRHRIGRFFGALGLLAIFVLSVVASSASASTSTNCSYVTYNDTSYYGNERVMVDVWKGSNSPYPSSVQIGNNLDTKYWGRTSATRYGDHSASMWKPYIPMPRGTYSGRVFVSGGPTGGCAITLHIN